MSGQSGHPWCQLNGSNGSNSMGLYLDYSEKVAQEDDHGRTLQARKLSAQPHRSRSPPDLDFHSLNGINSGGGMVAIE